MKSNIVSLFHCFIVSSVKDWVLCLFSAILLILSFPNFNLWILAWFAFVPLLFALRDKSPAKAFLLSFFTGMIAWSGLIYWLYHVTFIGLVLLILYLALYFGIFGFIIRRYPLPVIRYPLPFFSSIWVLLEYLRSHLFTGFGWALLGYSQYLNLSAIQIADIAGAWGVSFLVMMVNVFIYRVIGYWLLVIGKKQKAQLSVTSYLLPLFILFLSLGYGFYKLRRAPIPNLQSSIKISVIQGNIPQSIKWQEYAKEEIFQQYLSLTRESLRDNPELVIWPEAALPGIMGEDARLRDGLEEFVYELKLPLLVGAARANEGAYYNSALLVSENGEIIQRYDKLHLVPFGEYVPLKRIFGFLQTVVPIGDFTPGKEYTLFSLDLLASYPVGWSARLDRQAGKPANRITKFPVLICFEDILPQISRRFVKKGADFLVNITNDAWFGDTSSPYQHLQASVFRAVENGVYLVRAANTGVSGFITPNGKLRLLIDERTRKPTFVSGWKTSEVYFGSSKNTMYNRWGNWFILVCLGFSVCAVVGRRRI